MTDSWNEDDIREALHKVMPTLATDSNLIESVIAELNRPQPEFVEGQVVRTIPKPVEGTYVVCCDYTKWSGAKTAQNYSDFEIRHLTPEEVGPRYLKTDAVQQAFVQMVDGCRINGSTEHVTDEFMRRIKELSSHD